jgi:tetratricopeptide (TPR) repeat protein
LDVLAFRFNVASARGQVRQARELARQAEEGLERLHLQGKADIKAQLASVEALVGDRAEANTDVNDALRLSQTFAMRGSAATTLALLHKDQKALALADEIQRARPNDTLAINVTVPVIRAVVALLPTNLAKADPAKAIDYLNTAAVYGRADDGVLFARGLAYQQAGRYTEAQQDMQTVINMKSHHYPDIVFTIAQLESARIFQKQGDIPKARIAYQNFLADWKDADPDLPLLHEAKAEYAKLQ